MNACTAGAEAGNCKHRYQRSCVDCHATRTPLWRGGPAGPRSLCNACGIRYRKQKRGLHVVKEREKEKEGKGISGREKKLMRLVLGKEWKRKLREEEEAAILLMALSFCA